MLTGQLVSKSLDDYEREAKSNLESYPAEFRLAAAVIKIACLRQEVDRQHRAMTGRVVDESEGRMHRRQFSKVGENVNE